MSTEDPSAGAPRTRAEARAAREAAERDAAREAAQVPEIPAAPEEGRLRLPAVAQPASSAEPAPPAQEPDTRRFLWTILAVVGILAVVVAGLSIVSLLQGPRIDQVQADPAEAIQVSGSRVILTANQSLDDVDASQVTVEPAVPFTVDAAGRSIGIRFTVPLDDATEYTVKVADVTGAGGGPSSDLTTRFTTPSSQIFLLNRSEEDDTIFRTDLSGERAVPIFTHPRINDYRATSTSLVVAVENTDGSRILVMDLDGKNTTELPLPGDGYVSSVQVSERGGLVGYTYSDKEITADSGRASVLVTQPLSGEGEPEIIEVGGEQASIAEWQFVPDSAAVLFIDFSGALSLDDRAGDAGSQNLGLAMRLLGVSRGTYTAIVERGDQSIVELDLADGSETPLAASDPDYGAATSISPYPGGTLRHIVARDDAGLPTGQAIIRVDDDGAATPLLEVESGNAILQACASPSGQYAAVTVAPKLTENPYDDMLVPLPTTLETHLFDLRNGDELVALTGFDVSWCPTAPGF
ncbi:Ig-like domain-containing protein [Microbacterium paludicola]|uniref:Ig-like domain-containing protein n=1 Tax=Microbacterium paludicola TaxID=300019 RepID=UPI00119D8DEE|nr:Ig-like domain-containing protein [Microbacterium paludicola]